MMAQYLLHLEISVGNLLFPIPVRTQGDEEEEEDIQAEEQSRAEMDDAEPCSRFAKLYSDHATHAHTHKTVYWPGQPIKF
jgi:hypothetical protein